MNKERILALADIIEAQPHTLPKADSGFNMCSYKHSCGTPSCIAGFAEIEAYKVGILKNTTTWAALEWLGFDIDRSTKDFNSIFELFSPDGYSLRSITPAQAAHTLRNLAETGKVDWSHAVQS